MKKIIDFWKLRFKLFLKNIISGLFASYIGPRCEGILMRSDSGLFLVPPSDLSFARSFSVLGTYNETQVEALKAHISPTDRVLVVGTHVGSLVVPLARRCREVVGVEANPQTHGLLQKNLLLNGLTNVTVHNMAAFDRKTSVPFLRPKENTGGGKILQADAPALAFVGRHEVLQVQADRMDDFLRDQVFDVIITDIEGAEMRAFQGMQQLFSRCAYIIPEVCPWTLEELARASAVDFFSLIPERFNEALPIDAPLSKKVYERSEFPGLYKEIRKDFYYSGVDVLFRNSEQARTRS